MTCDIGLILDAYHSLSKTDSPKITEEFMNKMLEHEKALNMLEIRTETDPLKKKCAFVEVAKNEGSKLIFYSFDRLLILVSEALRSMKSNCR